jgi:hypothetical protein
MVEGRPAPAAPPDASSSAPKKQQPAPSIDTASRNKSGNRQWHRRGAKLDRRERAKMRARRLAERESNYLARLTARIRALGGAVSSVRQIPQRVWVMAAQSMSDLTGRAARVHVRKMGNRTCAGAVLRAALGEDATRSWSKLRTRRIATLGLVLHALARSTKRRGIWQGVVIGIPRGALAALLRDPYDQSESATPSITALFGTHRPGAHAESGQLGYFLALRNAGVAYRQQLPAHEATRAETWGPRGYAFNRYWLITDKPWQIDDEDTRRGAEQLADYANADARRLETQLARDKAAPAATPPPN